MAKKSIRQDLIIRGLDPANVVIGEDGMFAEVSKVPELVVVPEVTPEVVVDVAPIDVPVQEEVAVLSVEEEKPSEAAEAIVEAPAAVESSTVEAVPAMEEEVEATDSTEEKPSESALEEEVVSETPAPKKTKSKRA